MSCTTGVSCKVCGIAFLDLSSYKNLIYHDLVDQWYYLKPYKITHMNKDSRIVLEVTRNRNYTSTRKTAFQKVNFFLIKCH